MGDRRPMIVAVDGPAGSGKSSVCAQVCAKIGWTYVNTGFLYRAVAFLADQKGSDLGSEAELVALVEDLEKNHDWNPQTQSLFYRGEDITPFLGSQAMGAGASKVGQSPLVRERLLPLQRQLSLKSPVGAIVDGRDIGTVVFPDADLKIFMTASLEERAKRRMAQLQSQQGQSVPLEEIKRDIAGRDQQDQGRSAAPLVQADDAFVLDTSSMGVDETIEKLMDLLKQKNLL